MSGTSLKLLAADAAGEVSNFETVDFLMHQQVLFLHIKCASQYKQCQSAHKPQ